MECTIRPSREGDADEISAVILRTLRETNAKDYAREIIEGIEHSFSRSAVLQLIGKRTVFVAAIGSRIVGTASLDGSVVRTVFECVKTAEMASRMCPKRAICRLLTSSAIALPADYAGGKSRPSGSLIQRTVCSSEE